MFRVFSTGFTVLWAFFLGPDAGCQSFKVVRISGFGFMKFKLCRGV